MKKRVCVVLVGVALAGCAQRGPIELAPPGPTAEEALGQTPGDGFSVDAPETNRGAVRGAAGDGVERDAWGRPIASLHVPAPGEGGIEPPPSSQPERVPTAMSVLGVTLADAWDADAVRDAFANAPARLFVRLDPETAARPHRLELPRTKMVPHPCDVLAHLSEDRVLCGANEHGRSFVPPAVVEKRNELTLLGQASITQPALRWGTHPHRGDYVVTADGAVHLVARRSVTMLDERPTWRAADVEPIVLDLAAVRVLSANGTLDATFGEEIDRIESAVRRCHVRIGEATMDATEKMEATWSRGGPVTRKQILARHYQGHQQMRASCDGHARKLVVVLTRAERAYHKARIALRDDVVRGKGASEVAKTTEP